ncbi:TPA: hypothetical protein ACNIB0_001475 [Citrobacter koseri]|uniref:hypothetical protein n=1 Tax=Citrobacter koseri TaxID=545 RepID=UPI00254B926B|nr:hypothetical protein [Citrobacter koseri]MEC5643521.1 hypothetical protein [Citrobacter koseri]
MRNTEMKNVMGNTGSHDKCGEISRAEAEKNNILYFCCQADGSDQFMKSESPGTVIEELDSGRYDVDPVSGMRLAAALWAGMSTGCFTLTDEQHLVLWRWVVVSVYIREMRDANGKVSVKNEQGEPEEVTVYTGERGGIVIYPWSERFALAHHIEGLAYEMFPAEKAAEMAMAIYRSMLEHDPVTGFRMSAQGLKGMALLHDGFIETLQTEGIPAAPVVH